MAAKPETPASQLERRCADALTTAKGSREQIVALGGKTGTATRDAVLTAFNRMQTALSNAEAESSLWRSVHPDSEMRRVAESCERDVAALATALSLDRQLYEVFAALQMEGADAGTTRLVTKTLEDFKRSGVDKDEATRRRIRQLNDEIVKVGQEFSKTIIQDKRTVWVDPKELDGLPQDWIDAHKKAKDGENAGKVGVTTDYPDYIPFMTYSTSDRARRELYTVYRQRGTPDNTAHLQRLLELRHELATLLGYANWAAFVTENKMIGSEKNAAEFIEKIRTIADKRMVAERKLLLAELKTLDPKAKQVEDWQQAFVLGRVKKKKFDFDAQALRPYFHYDKVKKGLLDLTASLFGLEYRPADVPVWHDEVEAFDVYEKEGAKLLGRIFLDMHPRDDKYKHAAQFTLKNGLQGSQLPEGVLVCNFPSPKTGNGLMEHKQVETFFHEFGHLMHHVLGGKQKWMRFSGVATEWDFVEAPSQIFEEWATDYETLARFATNAKGETIPKALVEKMRRAEELGKALWVRHQMFYASVSLSFHNRDPKGLDHDKLVGEMMGRYSPYPFVDGTHMQNSFGHLNGYSAIYYTYMWSLVIAKDMFSRFEKAGILDPATAMAYRRAILEPGGSKDAAELVRDFLGRAYDFKSFQAWLERD
ncbi:MAG: Zn-dependent oligopeptidase [Deltaproteobacteria bacterium]|nr:Zn-dependent oligopeptidase [Deltaproteobacteria bacterium]